MSSFSRFCQLLNDGIQHNTVTPISFSAVSGLSSGITNLAVAVSNENLQNKKEDLFSIVKDYEAVLQNKCHNGIYTQDYEKLADSFALALHEGITNLKQIHKTVSALSSEITDYFDKRVAEDPVLAAYLKNEKGVDALQMEGIDWGVLDRVCEAAIVGTIHDQLNQPSTEEIQPQFISLAINKLPNANYTNQKEFAKISITDEKINTIVDKIYLAIQKRFPKEDIRDVVYMTAHFNQNDSRTAVINLTSFAEKEPTKITEYLNLIDLYKTILPELSQEAVDVSAATYQSLQDKVKCISDIMSVASYICSYYRNVLWKNAILVKGPFINTDNWKAFVADGGKVSQLVQYYNMFKDQTPQTGYSLDFMKDAIKGITAKVEQELTKKQAECEEKKRTILRNAFCDATFKWLASHKGEFSPSFKNTDIAHFVASNYDYSPKEPVETKLYNVIMNSCYVNTIERNLYNRLNDLYTKHSVSTETLTQKDLDAINIQAYASLVVDYLFQKGIILS